jgi:hypothetical protein
MKINRLLSSLLIGVSVACQKDSLPVPTSANPACFEDNLVIHQAKRLKGIIGYRKDISMYTVDYIVPKTIDSRWVGLVCNLPTSYQVVGKEVSFSGEYRSTSGKVSPQFGGDEMYYLYLSFIK